VIQALTIGVEARLVALLARQHMWICAGVSGSTDCVCDELGLVGQLLVVLLCLGQHRRGNDVLCGLLRLGKLKPLYRGLKVSG